MEFLAKRQSRQQLSTFLCGLAVVLLLFLTIYTSETAPSFIFKSAGATQMNSRNHNEPATNRSSRITLSTNDHSTNIRPSSSIVRGTRDFLTYQTNATRYGTNKSKGFAITHAAVANPNCSLRLPDNPLTAQGLATPYQLFATDKGQGACNEANPNQSAFVQAVIFDPAANTLSAYEPLVIDQGTDPAIAPVVPQLSAGAMVALWFGFNGTILHLENKNANDNCVNGLDGSDFGQFAYCNAPQFFTTVNAAIQAGSIKVPPLGAANDGQVCPSTRSFAVVDMDQSDNVQTQYLANNQGQVAQLSATNITQLPNAITLGNPSDNALVSRILDPTLGCQAWAIPDLVNTGVMTPTLATDELQAAASQQAPIGLVPPGDEMVLVDNKPNLDKVNAYRAGVDQTPAITANDADTKTYCNNVVNIALPRLQMDTQTFLAQPSPDKGATENSLFTFLANRLHATLSANGLNCVGLLDIQNPVTLTTDGNGVVTAAKLAITGTGTGTGTPNCNVNGKMITGCMGTTNSNGQNCTVTFTNGTVSVTCTPGTVGVPVVANMPPFNNSGVSQDKTINQSNFDNRGQSYSQQMLQQVGITAGQIITFDGVSFTWPTTATGLPDNVQAQGQTIPVTPINNATTLAFLGAASHGPSEGMATITYTDGTTQPFMLAFSDWTLNAAKSTPLNVNKVVEQFAYRNQAGGTMQGDKPNIFYTSVALQAGKSIQSVTLPATVNHGSLHVFAISTK